MRKVIVELIILAIAVGLTVEVLKSAIPYLPWIWLVVLTHYTWEGLRSDRVLTVTRAYKERTSRRRLMWSYVLVALVGAALFIFYWWGLNRLFSPQIAAYEAEQALLEHPQGLPSPATATVQPNTSQVPQPTQENGGMSPRSFTKRKPKELLAFYKVIDGISPLQADDLMKPYMGQWIVIEGEAETNPVNAGHGTSQFIIVDDGARCTCTFAPHWRQDIKRIRIGDDIKAQGRISDGQNGATLYLLDCDLLKERTITDKPEPVKSPENPIDLIDFDSIFGLTVKNLSNYSMYVIDVQITQELETKYIALGFEVASQHTEKFSLKGNTEWHSIPKLSDTWKDHVQSAVKQYGAECLEYVYFSVNDSGLATMKDHYQQEGTSLGIGDATGVIHYRLSNSSVNTAQTRPLVVTVVTRSSCDSKLPS